MEIQDVRFASDPSVNSLTRHEKIPAGPGIQTQHFVRLDEVALTLAEQGYFICPVEPLSKACRLPGRQHFEKHGPSSSHLAKWLDRYPAHGVGIICGRTLAIDIDHRDAVFADKMEEIVRAIIPGEPLKRVGQPPKRLLVYRSEVPLRTSRLPTIDFLGSGSYFVAFGVHPVTRLPYEWIGPSPLERPLIELPAVDENMLRQVRSAFAELFGKRISATSDALPRPCSQSAKIADGRDEVLTKLVWSMWCNGSDDAHEIAQQAWTLFADRVDLERPKQNGSRHWTPVDALRKARRLVNSGKRRPPSSYQFGTFAPETGSNTQRFFEAINAIAAAGLLAPASVAVSNAMLQLARGPDGCFASPMTLASKLNYAVGTVKRARRQLVNAGLWRAYQPERGRGFSAHYFPEVTAATLLARKVTRMGTRSSIVEEESPHENSNLEQNKIIDPVFSSLGIWMDGGER